MKKQIIIVGIIVLLVTIELSGCVKEETVKAVTIEDIKERFLQAVENVTSYKFSVDGTYNSTRIKKSNNSTVQYASISGEIDVLNKRVRTYNNGSSDSGEKSYFIFYLVDNMSYFGNQADGNWTWENWSSHLEPQQVWNANSYLELFSNALENETAWNSYNVTLEQLSDEKVGDVDCYVLQFIGFKNESLNYSISKTSGYTTGYSYKETDIEYMIAKDTFQLRKILYNTTSDENTINSYGNVSRYINTIDDEMFFYDYNVPLSIELPPEAKNASSP
jgi:hypothetical protein